MATCCVCWSRPAVDDYDLCTECCILEEYAQDTIEDNKCAECAGDHCGACNELGQKYPYPI